MVIGVEEAAALLGVSTDTIYRYAGERNGIPAFKVGWQWRFHRERLLSWMQEKKKPERGKHAAK